MRQKFLRIDPRYFQIAALGTLLFYGCASLGFEIDALQITLTLTTAIGVQLLLALLTRTNSPLDVRSALITGLSLCLLLRTNIAWFAVVAAAAAILSKFVFRFRGKHLFNPANFGLVILLLTGPRIAWCSAGQWGATAVLTFFFVGLGLLVVHRARRDDISFRVSCGLRSTTFRPVGVPRRTLVDPMASTPERRAAAFRLLYDLGSAKYAKLLARPADIRMAGRTWCRPRSIRIKSAKRPFL